MSISDLSKFRADKEASVKPNRADDPFTPVFEGRVLAVDQSLRKAGWVVLDTGGALLAQGVIGVVSEETGHAGTLALGTLQFNRYLGLIEEFSPDLVVHELPPVSRPGNNMSRPESSLVSANSLRCAAFANGIPTKMVGAQRAKHRWTGKRDAEKKEVRAALLRIDPTLRDRKPFNEHVADAIALGWLAMEEGQ